MPEAAALARRTSGSSAPGPGAGVERAGLERSARRSARKAASPVRLLDGPSGRRCRPHGRPGCPAPGAMRRAGRPGQRRGWRGRRTDGSDRRVAHWCSLACIRSTRASASDGVGHGAPVFTGDLLGPRPARSLAPFALWPAFPASDTPRPPPHPDPSADDGPARRDSRSLREGTAGMVPTFTSTDRRGRCPALPLPPHHGDAAGVPRGLRVRRHPPAEEFSARRDVVQMRAAAQPRSTRLEPVSSLEGVPPLVQTYTDPSACRTRIVWQCRPVPSLSGLLLPSLRPWVQAAPSFTGLLRQASGGPFHPTRSWRLVALDVGDPEAVGNGGREVAVDEVGEGPLACSSRMVVRTNRRRWTPARWSARMSRATRLREAWWPASARSAQIRGTPYVPAAPGVAGADRVGQGGVRDGARGARAP